MDHEGLAPLSSARTGFPPDQPGAKFKKTAFGFQTQIVTVDWEDFEIVNGKLSWCWKSEKIFYRQDTVFMFLLLLRLPAEFGDFLEILERLDVKIL